MRTPRKPKPPTKKQLMTLVKTHTNHLKKLKKSDEIAYELMDRYIWDRSKQTYEILNQFKDFHKHNIETELNNAIAKLAGYDGLEQLTINWGV